MATIAVLGTLDSKGEEHAFVAGLIAARGHRPLLIDVGTGGPATVVPDITREQVAAAIARVVDAQREIGDRVVGAGVAGLANVLTVRKVDDLTVGVDLFRAQNDFPESLAFPSFSMRATAQLASAGTCLGTPIGTGPFVMQSWSTNELVVTKNPNYWRTDPTKPTVKLPFLDKISYILVAESSQRAAAVRKKTVDAAIFTGRTDNTFIADLEQRKKSVTAHFKCQHTTPLQRLTDVTTWL